MSKPFIAENGKYQYEILSLEEAKKWLRMDIPGYNEEDTLIENAIKSAIDSVERDCNLSLGVSTYEWYPDCRPCDFADVFYVKSIVGVSYFYDSTYTNFDASDYRLIRTGERKSKIVWNKGIDYNYYNHKITFTAGFAEGQVPDTLLKAIRALIGAEFDERKDGIAERKTLSDKLKQNFQIGFA